MVTAAMNLKTFTPWKKAVMNIDPSILKSKENTLKTKVYVIKAIVFPVVMYGCESWTKKKAEHQRIDAFKFWCWTLESPLDSKEIKPVNPKGNQHQILTDAEAEALILQLPDVKSPLTGKDPDAGKD